MTHSTRPDIRSLRRPDLVEWMTQSGEPDYRVNQVLAWLYLQRVASFEEMTNLPRALRQKLATAFALSLPKRVRDQQATDSTRKFLWQLEDGAMVESVLIPANPALYGDQSDRRTLCISTQIGCAYGCKFCASGLDGWKRDLRPEEIVGQVIAVEQQTPTLTSNQGVTLLPADETKGESATSSAGDRIVTNIVVMGMGEPLANYQNLLRALEILNADWGGRIGARKITISTSGLVPQIRRLADEPYQFGLAISLHAATDPVRNRLMPVNRKYPLKDLVQACEDYLQKRGRFLTLEYILIDGVNTDMSQVPPLAHIARRLRAKVNLIPYNTVDGLPWQRPGEHVQRAFLAGLEQRRISVTLRREKGGEIDGACGQLRLRTEKEFALARAKK